MKTRTMFAAAACLLLLNVQPAAATAIYFDIANISGSTWEYNYTVNNDTLGIDIDEFTIYFSLGDYENLSIVSAPATWDSLTIEPDNFLQNDGFYDSLALTSGITPGSSLGIFSVRFDYLGAGTPGTQFFEVVDKTNFDVLDFGQTDAIPIPSAVWLFSSGLLGLVLIARRKVDDTGGDTYTSL